MPITSQLTSIENFNGTPSFVSYGGGQGATVNTDVIIEGTQSAGRRVDNTTGSGFGVTITSTDLSASNVHIKVWLFVTQWPSVTKVQIRISSGADDDHELPNSEFPSLGGFIPVWVDVSRTPELGGTANEAAITEIGVLLDIGDVGGNAQNLIIDEIMSGTSGLVWSGTGGTISDFRTYENTNNEGNIVTSNGVDFCYSRIEIGNATATTFTDSGFTIIYPDQGLVSSTFMGFTCDLQNASTSISLSDATIQSANPSSATRRPDFIVNGTSGSLSVTSVNILGVRTADFTSGCTVDGGIIDSLNLTQGSAEIKNAVIRSRAASGVALMDDPTFSLTGLHDVEFVQSGSGHAIEITSVGSYTLTGITFSGFGADGTNSAAIYNNSGGAVTLNISGGGDSPTIRNGTGASTTIVSTISWTIEGMPTGAELTITDTAATPNELFHVEATVTGTETYAFDQSSGGTAVVVIVIPDPTTDGDLEIYESEQNLPNSDSTLKVSLTNDRVYNNP